MFRRETWPRRIWARDGPAAPPGRKYSRGPFLQGRLRYCQQIVDLYTTFTCYELQPHVLKLDHHIISLLSVTLLARRATKQNALDLLLPAVYSAFGLAAISLVVSTGYGRLHHLLKLTYTYSKYVKRLDTHLRSHLCHAKSLIIAILRLSFTICKRRTLIPRQIQSQNTQHATDLHIAIPVEVTPNALVVVKNANTGIRLRQITHTRHPGLLLLHVFSSDLRARLLSVCGK